MAQWARFKVSIFGMKSALFVPTNAYCCKYGIKIKGALLVSQTHLRMYFIHKLVIMQILICVI